MSRHTDSRAIKDPTIDYLECIGKKDCPHCKTCKYTEADVPKVALLMLVLVLVLVLMA